MNYIANMMTDKLSLIIPVENQVRELDPKLLLACIAARRGFSCIMGSHRIIDFRIASFPPSLYLNKSFTVMNLKMFKIMRKLGHQIVTWDEEALVHLPAAMYYSRRLSPLSLRYVSHLFAWGEDNAELWRQYPEMPKDMPIHITGNPRGDLLRPEMSAFYQDSADYLGRTYGNFILVNTNFNHVNAFYPSQNLFKPAKAPGAEPKFGKAARGMTREFAEALRDHKQTIFDHFKKLIPALDKEFPDFNIIVRPHPTENQEIYQQIASECQRVKVTNEGNVVPWLLAAKALIHNGCTTGVEAYAMRVPAISYRAAINEEIDQGFYRLPHQLSYQCYNFDELRETLGKMLSGEIGAIDEAGCRALFNRCLAAQDGSLACERMVDVLEEITQDRSGFLRPAAPFRWAGRSLADGRRLIKWLKSFVPGSHAPPEFHRHRFPGVSLEELRRLVLKFQKILGDKSEMKIEQIYDQIFRIST
jgi:surface carbohydrate biosynthesis protein